MMTSESEPHERGNDHPPHLLDERFYVHANQPRNMGAIPKAEGKATGVGVCGDSIEISLSILNLAILNIGQIPYARDNRCPNADCGREVGILRFSAFT